MRVGVIGAGPAGLTAALELVRRGAEVVVYEAGDAVGGMARSFDLWGQRVDLGPHRFFSHDERVNALWLDLVGDDHRRVRRKTRILFRGRFVDYPLRPLDALAGMGLVDGARCLLSYAASARASTPPGPEESFESLMVRRFGRRLFEIFFRSYSEKVWGVPCSQLSADFAIQRIRDFSLGEAIRGLWSGIARGRHATAIDAFLYPLGGAGEVYQRMARRIAEAGGEVRCRSPVAALLTAGTEVLGVRLADGSVERHDHVVSTMPLPVLVRGLPAAPDAVLACARRLRFRHAALVYLHVDSPRLFPDQWVYVHSPDVRMGRVTNFRNWIPELTRGRSTTILAVEYWHDDGDPMATADRESMVARAEGELRSTGLLTREKVLDGCLMHVPRCYPVYALGYRESIGRIESFIDGYRGLSVIGRAGAFKYNNQDHSMLMGIQAAENILARDGHDLWAVNTDFGTYQEAVATRRSA